jgi:hypothetical protein
MTTLIKSKKAWFAAAVGKQISRTAVNMPVIEEWPDMLISIRKVFGDELEVTDTQASAGTRVWLKPKVMRNSVGTISCNSRDYAFQVDDRESYGQISALNLCDGDMYLSTFSGGSFVYKIIND